MTEIFYIIYCIHLSKLRIANMKRLVTLTANYTLIKLIRIPDALVGGTMGYNGGDGSAAQRKYIGYRGICKSSGYPG